MRLNKDVGQTSIYSVQNSMLFQTVVTVTLFLDIWLEKSVIGWATKCPVRSEGVNSYLKAIKEIKEIIEESTS